MVHIDTLTKNGHHQPILGRGHMTTDAWGTQKVSENYSLFHLCLHLTFLIELGFLEKMI